MGLEKLWDANCDLTANFALSTQQTADFLVDKDFDTFNDFPDIDTTVEKVLSEAEAAGPVSVRTLSAPEHESAITNQFGVVHAANR